MPYSVRSVAKALVRIHMNKPNGVRAKVSRELHDPAMKKITKYIKKHPMFAKLLESSGYTKEDLYRMCVNAR